MQNPRYRWLQLALPLVIIALYFTPFFILGENAAVPTHDNIDSNLVWELILLRSGEMFGPLDATVPQMLGGIPRNCFVSEFSATHLFFAVLPPFYAYVAHMIAMHTAAFFGMYLLLSRHVTPNPLIAPGVALAFALLPFWPFGGLSIAGLPLVLYAFLNIRKHESIPAGFLILAVVPFYSWFVYSYAFFLAVIGAVWAYDLVRTRQPNYTFLLAIVFMGAVFCLVEYRMIYSIFLDPGYVSHRTEFVFRIPTIAAAAESSLDLFLSGQDNTYAFQWVAIIPALVFAGVMAVWRRIVSEGRLLIALLVFIALTSLFYGFATLLPLPDISGFQFNRMMWLNPLAWYLIFAVSLAIIWKSHRYGGYLAVILLVVQAGFLFSVPGNDVIQAGGTGLLNAEGVSFRSFYSPALYAKIRDDVGRPQDSYRVGCIGIEPAVVQYNGFYTIDGYLINYPLEYKHRFRTLIENELARNGNRQVYFDRWGSRCYVFTAEKGRTIYRLNLNESAYGTLDLDYIFSASEIKNYRENNLSLVGEYGSRRKIRVYSIDR